MIRNYGHLNLYLNQLMQDVYPQPPDDGHSRLAMTVFHKWFVPNRLGKSILDVGCGDEAFMRPHFESIGMKYTGIALKSSNPHVTNMDFTFLDYEDESFDCVFSRHALEHSPMPLISLMEWYRVSNFFLCLIIPNPQHYGWSGKNHYSMLSLEQSKFLLNRAGWHIIWEDFDEPTEFRFMCEKKKNISYE